MSKDTINPPYYHSLEGQKMKPKPRWMRRKEQQKDKRELKKLARPAVSAQSITQ